MNYPHALAVIDGKHVVIKKPANCGSYYYNNKKVHSIILWRSLGQITNAYGQMLDVLRVWSKSRLHQGIQDVTIKLPENDLLSKNHRDLR